MRSVCVAVFLVLSPLSLLAQPFQAAWPDTDFSRSSVDLDTIFSGGPPRDGIPALTDPVMMRADADTVLGDDEAVLTVVISGQAPRAYPIRYLMWHEIANDRIGDVPVAVTFCPLCNSAMVFDRRVEGMDLEFGVSGLLRHSDMVMYDRQTESWWQQATAEAIVGELTGTDLMVLPSWMESWSAFLQANPDGLVMAEPADWARAYGSNPYVGYDLLDQPFLYSGEDPPHGIPPLERVIRVGDRAWPMTRVSAEGVIEEAGVTIQWQAGLASALETARVDGGRDVGMVRVRDAAGADIAHDVMFAFAFHAFWPEGTWMLP